MSWRCPPPRPSSEPHRRDVSAGDSVSSIASAAVDDDDDDGGCDDDDDDDDVAPTEEEDEHIEPVPCMCCESAPDTSNIVRRGTPKSLCMGPSQRSSRPSCKPLALQRAHSRLTASPRVRRRQTLPTSDCEASRHVSSREQIRGCCTRGAAVRRALPFLRRRLTMWREWRCESVRRSVKMMR